MIRLEELHDGAAVRAVVTSEDRGESDPVGSALRRAFLPLSVRIDHQDTLLVVTLPPGTRDPQGRTLVPFLLYGTFCHWRNRYQYHPDTTPHFEIDLTWPEAGRYGEARARVA